MKNLILISALVLSVVSTVFSQKPDDKVFEGVNLNNKKINNGLLEKLIFLKINKELMNRRMGQMSFDKTTYRSSEYIGRFINTYVKERKYLNEDESLDGLTLKTPQDRLDHFSLEENVNKRKVVQTFIIPCINCSLDEWYGMTYDELSTDFVNRIFGKLSNEDVVDNYSNSKYMGVSVSFDIEEGYTIRGEGIYKLTISTLTSTDGTPSI